MIHNIDLVEENQAVQHAESRVIKNARKNHVLEVEKTVRPVDLVADVLVLYGNNFLEFGRIGEVLAMIRAVRWKVGIVCNTRLALTAKAEEKFPLRTF